MIRRSARDLLGVVHGIVHCLETHQFMFDITDEEFSQLLKKAMDLQAQMGGLIANLFAARTDLGGLDKQKKLEGYIAALSQEMREQHTAALAGGAGQPGPKINGEHSKR